MFLAIPGSSVSKVLRFTYEYHLNMNKITLKTYCECLCMWVGVTGKACIFNINVIVEHFPCSPAYLRRCNLLVWFSWGFFFFSLSLIASSFIRPKLNRSPDFSLDYRETEFLPAGILQPGALIPEEFRHMGADADRQAFPSATGSNNSDMVLQTTSITAQLKKDDIWLHPWSMHHQNTALVMFQAWFRWFCEVCLRMLSRDVWLTKCGSRDRR